MDYAIYALRIAAAAEEAVADYLGINTLPPSVRLATTIPVSNQGYPPDSVGALLRLDERGVLVGVEGVDQAPKLLVPWDNIGYLAEGLGEL